MMETHSNGTTARTGGPRDQILPLFEDLERRYLEQKFQALEKALGALPGLQHVIGRIETNGQAHTAGLHEMRKAQDVTAEGVRQLATHQPSWKLMGASAGVGVLVGVTLTVAVWWAWGLGATRAHADAAAAFRELYGLVQQQPPRKGK